MKGRLRTLVLLCAGAVFFLACRRKEESSLSKDEVAKLLAEYDRARKKEASRQEQKRDPKPATLAGTTPARAPAGPAPSARAPDAVSERSESDPAPERAMRPKTAEPEGPWIADEPEPIAPAAPITATPEGVVMHSRANAIYVARLSELPRGAKPLKTPIVPVPKSAGTFPLGRGPGVFEGYGYWISEGKLLRRALPKRQSDAGSLEVLAEDARTGTRVATPIATPGERYSPLPQTVAYIVNSKNPEDPLLSKLWVEGAGTYMLTPQGASTHSIALIRQRDSVLAISMHGRTAMTPVHARRVTFAANKPQLHEDLVVWVGGGVQPLTEISLLPGPADQLRGFIPHERSITEFGIAELDIGQKFDENTPTRWLFYPNGIDPAPVDVGYLCGEPVILYAQPRTAAPDAPQQLVLRSLSADSDKAQEVARASAFYSVAYSETENGGLIAWVSDWVTWARSVRCRGS
jgi:hypothetical protein